MCRESRCESTHSLSSRSSNALAAIVQAYTAVAAAIISSFSGSPPALTNLSYRSANVTAASASPNSVVCCPASEAAADPAQVEKREREASSSATSAAAVSASRASQQGSTK